MVGMKYGFFIYDIYVGNLRVKVNFFNDWLVDFGEDNVFFVFVCFQIEVR